MHRVFGHPVIRALGIALASILVFSAGVYAEQTFWSGGASVMVEAPTGLPDVEVSGISVSDGTYDSGSHLWTISIKRGGTAYLYLDLVNNGGDGVHVFGKINGQAYLYHSDGVTLTSEGTGLAAGESFRLPFQVNADVDADPGTLPSITLEVVEG